MCDQYDNRGCEVVDELTMTISDLEMTITDLKVDFVKDLKEIAITINNHELARMKVEKWEAK